MILFSFFFDKGPYNIHFALGAINYVAVLDCKNTAHLKRKKRKREK